MQVPNFGAPRSVLGSACFRHSADAREELAADLADVVRLTDDVAVAARGFRALLASDDCYLLLAANNAEMRAGSGMFLQAGELCFDDGAFSLSDLKSTGALRLPDDAVPIEDRDLEDRWGPFLPNAEFRNLGLTPRFDATGALAARMWEAATGRAVAGALSVDPVALEVLLESTGAIDVDGRRYAAADIVDQLLVEQYEEALEGELDQDERRERLGAVARATVTAFQRGGWDLDSLAASLPDAVAGRHILGWSNDPTIQEAFVAMGMAGALQESSMAVSVLNRGGGSGGGKLDPFLDIDVGLSAEDTDSDGRSRDWLAEVRIENTVPVGQPTYAETIDEDTRFGVYEGILAVTLPGSAGRGRIEVDGEEMPLVAVGPDGPSRILATRFELAAEETRTFRVRFGLPVGLAEVLVEASARVPPTEWRTPAGRDEDGTGFTVALYDEVHNDDG